MGVMKDEVSNIDHEVNSFVDLLDVMKATILKVGK